MGQAKQRGTLEERIAQAQFRNAELDKAIKPKSIANRIRLERGTQRLATMMIASGILSPIKKS